MALLTPTRAHGIRVVQHNSSYPGTTWYNGHSDYGVLTGPVTTGNDVPDGDYFICNSHGARLFYLLSLHSQNGVTPAGTVVFNLHTETEYDFIPFYPERLWANSADIPWGQDLSTDYHGYLLTDVNGRVVGDADGGAFIYGSVAYDDLGATNVYENTAYTIVYNPSTSRHVQTPPPPRPGAPMLLAGDDAAPAQHRKVALNGRALPDVKPQATPETDTAREETYVDAYSLGLRHDTTDVYVPVGGGSELALQVRRSTAPEVWSERHGLRPVEMPDRPFGSGWTSNLGANIQFVRQTDLDAYSINVDAEYAYVTDEDGGTYRFLIVKDAAASGQERYVALPGARNGQEGYLNTLTADGAGHWTFVRKYGTRLTYEDSGIGLIVADDRAAYGLQLTGTQTHRYARLTRVEDRTGAALVYTYLSSGTVIPGQIAVAGNAAQHITINPNGQGQVGSVTDPRGNTWNYTYDAQAAPTVCQTLRSVTGPPSGLAGEAAPVTLYGYSVASIDDTLPGYPAEPHLHCDVSSIQDPTGNLYTFTYQADQTRQTFMGNVTGYRVTPGLPRLVSQVDLPGGFGSTVFQPHSFSAVVPGDLGSLVFYGHRASYVVDAEGDARLYQFSAPQLSILTTFKPYLPNREILDPYHVPRIVLFGAETITSFQGSNVAFNETDPASFSFSGSVVGTESFTFDLLAGMAPATATDMSGNTTAFTYGDAWDLSANYSFLSGTSYPFGRYADPTRQTDAQGQLKTFTYFPAPATGTFDARARRMTGVTDEAGRQLAYTLDARGNRTSEKIYEANGILVQWTDFEYNHPSFHGFMTARTLRACGGPRDPAWAVGLRTTYQADARGNVLNETVDPGGLNLCTQYTYDENNNKLTATDPKGYLTEFRYDARNHLYEVIYPATPATSPGINHKQFRYDLAGRKVKEIDERGLVTLMGYDALGRHQKTLRDMDRNGAESAGDLLTFGATFNACGDKETETDANDNVTTFGHDALGRLTTKTEPVPFSYLTQYFYDGPNSGGSIFASSSFHPTRTIDGRGYTTTSEYDNLYRLTRRQVQYGKPPDPVAYATTTYDAYDGVGNLLQETDPLGHVTRYSRDALNRLTSTTSAYGTPEHATRSSAFTSTGLAWRNIDELSRTTETQYDAAGRPRFTVQPAVDDGTGTNTQLQPVTERRYDDNGNLVALLGPLAAMDPAHPDRFRWDYGYDERNRRTSEMGPAVVDAENAPNGPAVRPVSFTGYDQAGNVVRLTNARDQVTDVTFDDANRPTNTWAPAAPVRRPDGSVASERPHTVTAYWPTGTVWKVTDPNGHVTTNTYDELNRLVTTTDAENNVVTNGYDAVGNKTSVKDGRNQTTAFAFDGLNRNTVVTDAAGQATTFTYDGVNKTKRVDAIGQETDYGYDLRNRLTAITYLGRTVDNRTYSLDAVGNILAVTLPNNGDTTRDVAYSFDALNRVSSETSFGLTHAYTYDLAGRRLRITYGGTGRVVTCAYDDLGRMTAFSEGGRATAYAYDLDGNALQKTNGNGETIAMGFDALSRVSRIQGSNAGGTELYHSAYTYDAGGNVRTDEEYSGSALPARTLTMGYDGADRLTSEAVTKAGATTTTTYGYDAAHNRTSKKVGAAAAQTLTYNNLNQLTAFKRLSYTYDANGNRITRNQSAPGRADGTQTTTYGYDVENRLVSVSVPSSSAATNQGGVDYTYAYDYRTRRVLKQATANASDPLNSVVTSVWQSHCGGGSALEYIASAGYNDGSPNPADASLAAEYLRGPDQGGGVGGLLYSLRGDSGGSPSYDHYDARGDVIAKTDATGVLTYQASYEAFGTRSAEYGSTADPQRANTKEEDPTGLLNEGQRYRDLESGVFITRDPLGFVDGPNLYAYVRQNPWSKFDPEGLEGFDPRGLQAVGEMVGNWYYGWRDRAGERERLDQFRQNNPSIAREAEQGLMGPALSARRMMKTQMAMSVLETEGLIPEGSTSAQVENDRARYSQVRGLRDAEADLNRRDQAGVDQAVGLASVFVPLPGRMSGSGPVPGVIELSSLRKSNAAFLNMKPGANAEFVFDPVTRRFVVGAPKEPVPGLSAHQNLASTIEAPFNRAVGGTWSRGSNGELLTNELSGHLGKNWTPETRKVFTETMESLSGQKVQHTPWSP